MCFAPVSALPAEVFDMTGWKINLPFDLVEISVANLQTYSDAHFRAPQAAVFVAPVEGVHTSGSRYARSELRETATDGSNTSWAASAGVHVMDATLRVTHLPVVTPKLVCAQVRNAAELLLIFCYTSGGKTALYATYGGSQFASLDTNYMIGTWFDISVRIVNGVASVFYNGVSAGSVAMVDNNCYFNLGCYLQSSTDPSFGNDAAGAYGRVEVGALRATHA